MSLRRVKLCPMLTRSYGGLWGIRVANYAAARGGLTMFGEACQ